MGEKMKKLIPKSLLRLAEGCSKPLYLVGGSVRNYLAGFSCSNRIDWDICSPMPLSEFLTAAEQAGFTVHSVFKNTGTVKLSDHLGEEYEYCSFRSDRYIRGTHVPVEIYFTDDIAIDARRRDFTANAVYFDMKQGEFVDPLNGISAIKEKRLTTVAPAEKVFGEDGLRLMRLARFAGTLGFSPDEECLLGAKNNAKLIRDITPERIYTELCAILFADTKYGVQNGHYKGLKILEETGVLAEILPELTLGKGVAQRADFHKYDVLEHSLRAVYYAEKSVRLAALLHDIGKPLCALRDGNFYAHPNEGAELAKSVLTRLKAPKNIIERIPALIEWHMYDLDCRASEQKVKRFFVNHYPILDELLKLKQADFSACMDDLSKAPTCARWEKLLQALKAENAPLTVKELALSGKDLLDAGISPPHISVLLQKLLLYTVCNPKENTKERLIKLAQSFDKAL